jgi:hypothetical protein
MVKIIRTLSAFALLVAFTYVLPAIVVTLIKCEPKAYFEIINNPLYAMLWGAISFIGSLAFSVIEEENKHK